MAKKNAENVVWTDKKNSIRERAKKVPKHIKIFVDAVMKNGITNFGEWQLCPVCQGRKEAIESMTLLMPTLCECCKGNQIIKRPIN